MIRGPRPFEPKRLRRALEANARVLLAVAVVALFAGAALARVVVPDEIVARAHARIARDPHLIVSRARADEVLAEAQRRSGYPGPVSALRERIDIGFRAPDALSVTVRTPGDEALARRLVDALVALYVERADALAEAGSSSTRGSFSAERAKREAELKAARTALDAALTDEGYPDLAVALGQARVRLDELVRAAEQMSTQAAAAQAKLTVANDAAREPRASPPAELAEAQRALSRLLVQHGSADHPDVRAAEQRLSRLQRTSEVARTASKQQQEAQALEARAARARQQVTEQRAELERLQRVSRRAAPLVARHEAALAALREHEALLALPRVGRSEVTSPAQVELRDRRALRVFASVLAPLVALCALLGLFLARELRAFRICAPSELAYWLDVPVLATSAWPRHNEALETLVDELADPALAARGIVLILPLTEVERPLATTLAAKLNARAQRQYRSTTGSRVTIAQPWIGEFASSRIRRAAEAADRVLWVVAADVHGGAELRGSRSLVGRREGVAAVLVDAEPSFGPRIGSAGDFWNSRAPEHTSVLQAPTASAAGR